MKAFKLKTVLSTACAVLAVSTLTMTSTETLAAEKVRWKVQAVFGTHLPGLGDPIEYVADTLNEATGGDVRFKVYEPGKIVPPFGITEAVKNKQIPAGYAWLAYDQGRIPSAALFSAVPFGMEPWAYAAWWYDGGGHTLAENIYAKHNIHPILCSVIGPETAGWFKKEIHSVDDLKGLKIRFAGIGGKVLQKAGASVTSMPSGEIFPALEKGAIDASEFSMPAVDKLLGFDKVVKHNYFPGWHQTFTASHLLVNTDVWADLSKDKQALITMACTAGTMRALTRGEAIQGEVLDEFAKKGVQTHTLSPEILKQLKAYTDEVMDDIAKSDADFKEVYESQQAFSKKYKAWKRLAYLKDE